MDEKQILQDLSEFAQLSGYTHNPNKNVFQNQYGDVISQALILAKVKNGKSVQAAWEESEGQINDFLKIEEGIDNKNSSQRSCNYEEEKDFWEQDPRPALINKPINDGVHVVVESNEGRLDFNLQAPFSKVASCLLNLQNSEKD